MRGGGGGTSWTRGSPFRLDPAEIDTFSDPVDRDLLSRIVGAPVRWRLVLCYAISAALAGIAGALGAQAKA